MAGRTTDQPGGGTPRGVDQALGDVCSAIAGRWAATTCVAAERTIAARSIDEGFANVLDLGATRMAVTSDGIGTKVECAERSGRYDTLGYDLVAMVVDDLAAIGAEPLGLSNILDADRLDPKTVESLMRGLAEAARSCGVAVLGGEIAQLGGRVGGYGPGMHVNWCATAVGRVPDDRPAIDGKSVEPGDCVIALRSNGWRSNGFSLIRQILNEAEGERWMQCPGGEATWAEIVLTPSRIYAPGIVALLRQGVLVHGIAHITGGGIPGNLARILRPNGLGAALTTLWPPHRPVLKLRTLGDVPPEIAYDQWNMGNGMLLAVAEEDAERACSGLASAGYEARRAGSIVAEPEIRIDASVWGLGRLSFPVERGSEAQCR